MSCIKFLQHTTDPSTIIAEDECHDVIGIEDNDDYSFRYDSLFCRPE